ncbi:hypothetical protein [Pelagicoccus sp. SDUM812002]|uniref:hypothetical protein n=1 Tax=Pelagicoccus sp. SDUM812002 TaxID=3041266 RepID=UPI00280F65A1|nr:hypothetical protein [Pelagicoccus sp. SDUM812002]MDQ8184228.1 hypothetical protein [Pelagicoccus sp. SDUM812002]
MRKLNSLTSADGTGEESGKRSGVICASVREGAPTLIIEDASGRRWIMPWVHLLHAVYESERGLDRIELSYASHTVTLEGVRLGGLVERIAKFGVEWVRRYDKRYLLSCPKDMPFIERIEVADKNE